MKASEQKQKMNALNLGMIGEQTTYVQKEKSLDTEKYRDAQIILLAAIKDVGQTNDPALILAAEKAILKNEKRSYGNSAGMNNSLNAAILEIAAAETLVQVVQDPVAYKAIDAGYSLPKSRIGGLPRDEARKSFRSHATRLLNMDKSRLTETEKRIIKARRNNLGRAEKVYITMQHKALGITPTKDRGRER